MDDRAWTVLYDAECGLCRVLLALLLHWDRTGRPRGPGSGTSAAHRGRLRPLPLQRAEAQTLLADLPLGERMASWHLVSPAGARWSAGAAAAPLLRLLPGGGGVAAVFARFPNATERGYRWVADHRSGLGRFVPSGLRRRADYLHCGSP